MLKLVRLLTSCFTRQNITEIMVAFFPLRITNTLSDTIIYYKIFYLNISVLNMNIERQRHKNETIVKPLFVQL